MEASVAKVGLDLTDPSTFFFQHPHGCAQSLYILHILTGTLNCVAWPACRGDNIAARAQSGHGLGKKQGLTASLLLRLHDLKD